MDAVCRNLAGWAQEVFLVDSYSKDDTVDIALKHGVHVVQRRFRGFGDQWNFALRALPITAPWTMKLDPDERISDRLKQEIEGTVNDAGASVFRVKIRLTFMGRRLPAVLKLARLWRTGTVQFSDVPANEHARGLGREILLSGEIEHLDSPDLHHWLQKQNRYTTAEAKAAYGNEALSDVPKLWGTRLQRRMWLKRNFHRVPFRYSLFFLYHWLWLGAWRAGWPGFAWARLRSDVMRLVGYKRREMEGRGREYENHAYGPGTPDVRVKQYE